MFKKIFIVWGLLSCILMAGCSTDLYDYDELNDRMDTFDKRLAELEDWCKETNTNIHSLKALVESLLQHDVITGVTPVLNENVVTGYTITFLNADPITLYHGLNGKDGQDGEDGKDGYTPLIGVKQDADGIYYWTLDGEWMTDAQGAKIKAQGEKGTDGENGAPGENGSNGTPGKDGITPQLKIEDGYWFITYDNGATWTKLGKATGEDGEDGAKGDKGDKGDTGATGATGATGPKGDQGDSMFQSVTQDKNYVYFTLADGTVIKIAKGNGSNDQSNDEFMFIVTYDANGGVGTMQPDTFYYGVSKQLSEVTYTKSSHSFTKWNTKADGTGISYTDMQSVVNVGKAGEEIMLYAIWNNI